MHNANRMTSTDLAGIIAAAAADKKARDVVVLDIRGKTTIADYFVICEGDTDRQVRAITDSITDACKQHGVRALAVAGLKDASWACADFDAVIAHVFLPGERTFYDLEGLWGDPAGERAVRLDHHDEDQRPFQKCHEVLVAQPDDRNARRRSGPRAPRFKPA